MISDAPCAHRLADRLASVHAAVTGRSGRCHSSVCLNTQRTSHTHAGTWIAPNALHGQHTYCMAGLQLCMQPCIRASSSCDPCPKKFTSPGGQDVSTHTPRNSHVATPCVCVCSTLHPVPMQPPARQGAHAGTPPTSRTSVLPPQGCPRG